MTEPSKPEISGAIAATSMFVEVLVIGIGALAAITGFVSAAAGYSNMQKVAPLLASTPASGAALAFSYALGVAIDRAADYLLTSHRRRIRDRHFSSNAAYGLARRAVAESPHITAMADYARSRMRVCRGWILNSLLLSLSSILLVSRFPFQDRASLIAIVVTLGGLSTFGFYAAWMNITGTSYRKLSQQAAELREYSLTQSSDEIYDT
ncbi:hypothetical protein [Streptomyces sp. S816]|uniref:hypothetical protein n=1 Tax=Streptomyces sp. S816 TaxID=2283197 RepID=UPI00109D7260|nr:hypothetical protein [Streptomyces sp. S816]